jgi:hypothetical protein
MRRGTHHPLMQARVWKLHTPPGVRPFVRVTCDECEGTFDQNCSVNTPPNVIANKLRQLGWRIKGEGTKSKCPTCIHNPKPKPKPPEPQVVLGTQAAQALAKEMDAHFAKPKEEPEVPQERCSSHSLSEVLKAFLAGEEMSQKDFADLAGLSPASVSRAKRCVPTNRTVLDAIAKTISELRGVEVSIHPIEIHPRKKSGPKPKVKTETVETPKPQSTTTDRGSVRKRQRMVFSLLEEHFDDDGYRFDDGWSDDRIAEETGLSVDYVVDTREEAFGPLVDPVLTGLEGQLREIEAQIVQARDEMHAEFTKRLKDLDNKLSSVRGEIAALRKGRH